MENNCCINSVPEEVFSPFQYLSIFWNNLGFLECPETFKDLEGGKEILEIERTAVIDYPITFLPLMFKKNGAALWNLLEAIKYWIYSPMKKGHLLDLRRSFNYPDKNELKFLIENKMMIKYSSSVEVEESFWKSSNIWMSRLHNLNPLINKHYFNNCLHKFEKYAKYIKIESPCAVFATALVNPDIVMSMIRNAEMKGAEIANEKYGGYYTLRQDYDMVGIFASLLNLKFSHLDNIYRNHGFKGLLILNKNFCRNVEGQVVLENKPNEYAGLNMNLSLGDGVIINYENKEFIHPDGSYDEFAMAEDKKAFIDSIVLGPEEKNFVFKYLDKESIPEILLNKKVYSDGSREDSELYVNTIKRLYVTIKQIEFYFPEYLDTTDKMILSNQFYLDNDRFCLFNRITNQFIVVNTEYKSYILSPVETVRYYKDKYNIEVPLDNDEMETESGEVPDFDIEEFDKNYDLYAQGYCINIPKQEEEKKEEIAPAINSTIINGYGFNTSNMIM